MEQTQEERSKKSAAITKLCEAAGCSDKIRKIHFEQYVDRRWNPHPPQAFRDWWDTHQDSNFIDAKRAYNCGRYQQEFVEAKQYGAA